MNRKRRRKLARSAPGRDLLARKLEEDMERGRKLLEAGRALGKTPEQIADDLPPMAAAHFRRNIVGAEPASDRGDPSAATDNATGCASGPDG